MSAFVFTGAGVVDGELSDEEGDVYDEPPVAPPAPLAAPASPVVATGASSGNPAPPPPTRRSETPEADARADAGGAAVDDNDGDDAAAAAAQAQSTPVAGKRGAPAVTKTRKVVVKRVVKSGDGVRVAPTVFTAVAPSPSGGGGGGGAGASAGAGGGVVVPMLALGGAGPGNSRGKFQDPEMRKLLSEAAAVSEAHTAKQLAAANGSGDDRSATPGSDGGAAKRRSGSGLEDDAHATGVAAHAAGAAAGADSASGGAGSGARPAGSAAGLTDRLVESTKEAARDAELAMKKVGDRLESAWRRLVAAAEGDDSVVATAGGGGGAPRAAAAPVPPVDERVKRRDDALERIARSAAAPRIAAFDAKSLQPPADPAAPALRLRRLPLFTSPDAAATADAAGRGRRNSILEQLLTPAAVPTPAAAAAASAAPSPTAADGGAPAPDVASSDTTASLRGKIVVRPRKAASDAGDPFAADGSSASSLAGSPRPFEEDSATDAGAASAAVTAPRQQARALKGAPGGILAAAEAFDRRVCTTYTAFAEKLVIRREQRCAALAQSVAGVRTALAHSAEALVAMAIFYTGTDSAAAAASSAPAADGESATK